jgi:hypothetical protein
MSGVESTEAYWCRFIANDGRPVPEAYDRKQHESRFFVTGSRMTEGDAEEVTVCVLIHAPDAEAAWKAVRRCFPEAACDNMSPHSLDWRPGGRFPGLKPFVVLAERAKAEAPR